MLPFSLVPLLLLLLSNPQIQAQSSCGDCHVANPDAPLVHALRSKQKSLDSDEFAA